MSPTGRRMNFTENECLPQVPVRREASAMLCGTPIIVASFFSFSTFHSRSRPFDDVSDEMTCFAVV